MNASTVPFQQRSSAPRAIPGMPYAPLTPLLGREAEVHDVIALLDRDGLRVVTLLGPGGVGKTRLAQEVTARIAPAFAHGAAFIPLAAIRDPALVPKAVARALGFQESGDRPAADLLVELLADRHMLLMLDNLEQVIGAAHPWLTDLIGRAPRLRVLVTSRVSLNIAGEQRYRVPPLPTSAASGEPSAAVLLFAQRARAVNPDFATDDQTMQTVAEICRELDGLPLAIELAAARMRLISPRALLARLTDRLTLLAGGHRNAHPRLRSMRDAINWSYELLSADEQVLFRRLAPFLGGFTLAAAAFVAAWPGPPGEDRRTFDLVQSLLDQSLVQRWSTALDTTRFRMLETIREFGLATLAETVDPEAAHRAHAAYFMDLAARSERALTGPDQAAWLDLLDAEYANIRAALTWLETHDRIADAIELLARIAFFLHVRGHSVEMLARLEPWLCRPDLQAAGRSRGLLLSTAGALVQNTGEFDRSVAMLTESAAMLQDAGDRWAAATACQTLAATYRMINDLDRMRRAAEAAVVLARPLDHHRVVSAGLRFMALHAKATGQVARGEALQRQSQETALRAGDQWMLIFDLYNRAFAALREGNLDDAERFAQESKTIAEALKSRRDIPVAWQLLAMVARLRGDYELAAERVAAALAIVRTFGYTGLLPELMFLSAIIEIERGAYARGTELLGGSFRLEPGNADAVDIAVYLDAYAELARRANDASHAARFLGACVTLLESAGVPLDPDFQMAGCYSHRDELRTTLGRVEFERRYNEGAAAGAAMLAAALAYEPPADPRPRMVSAGPDCGLTPREREVLVHMASGLSNQQIADALCLSHRTVSTHVANILAKLDLPSRTAAVSYAIREGWA